jgi:hypothetical protein
MAADVDVFGGAEDFPENLFSAGHGRCDL